MTEMEWLSGVDPRFDDLVDRIRAGRIGGAEARAELLPLLGHRRQKEDWSKAVSDAGPIPQGRDRALWELECFEKAYPRDHPSHRLRSSASSGLFERVTKALGIDRE